MKVLVVYLSCLAFSSIAEPTLNRRLSESGYHLVYESYVDENWELFVVDAAGLNARNLTQTPDVHELYPQVSPDGQKIAFVVDEGSGRSTVRSVYVMNRDGSGRRKVAGYARQPFWHPNGEVIAYLPQEYKKFNVVDYYTKGIAFFNLKTGETHLHPNEKLHHLYNPSFGPKGRWIVSTVHAGMGFKHAILLIEADGLGVHDLKIPGCRPVFSPDGMKVAWGPGDHELSVAEIDYSKNPPQMKTPRFSIKDEVQKIYHVDWSPDGSFLSLSRGPNGKGDISKPGTHASACEIVGVHAKGWNLIAVAADRTSDLNLNKAEKDAFVTLTNSGASNKESDWFE